MPKEKEPWVFPFEPGAFVTLRHSEPLIDEPHQIPGEVMAVECCKKGFNVRVKTEQGEFLVKGVNKKNFSLVFEP